MPASIHQADRRCGFKTALHVRPAPHRSRHAAGPPCRMSPAVPPLPRSAPGSARRPGRSRRWWPRESPSRFPDRVRCGTAPGRPRAAPAIARSADPGASSARGAVGLLRRYQQMHVVGHQHVRLDRAAEQAREFFQVVQVQRVVLVGEEAGAAVVATLDDVCGDAGKGQGGGGGASGYPEPVAPTYWQFTISAAPMRPR